MKKWTDYIGQTVNAKFTVERNIDGADVPVIREAEVTPYLDVNGSVCLDYDGEDIYPFEETFELIPKTTEEKAQSLFERLAKYSK